MPGQAFAGRQEPRSSKVVRLERDALNRVGINVEEPPDLLFVGRVKQHHSYDLAGIFCGEAAHEDASEGVADHNIRRSDGCRLEQLVKILNVLVRGFGGSTCDGCSQSALAQSDPVIAAGFGNLCASGWTLLQSSLDLPCPPSKMTTGPCL
jgi:hypothetical protein